MKYFPKAIEVLPRWGIIFSMQADMAWDLIRQNTAIIAGRDGGEDSIGRQRMELQAPKELVTRAFAIVDAFIEMAETRNDMQADSVTNEERMQYKGAMAAIEQDAAWKRNKTAK